MERMEKRDGFERGLNGAMNKRERHFPMPQKHHCTHLFSLSPPCMVHQFLPSLNMHGKPPAPLNLFLYSLESEPGLAFDYFDQLNTGKVTLGQS